jgi:hypothetical protein
MVKIFLKKNCLMGFEHWEPLLWATGIVRQTIFFFCHGVAWSWEPPHGGGSATPYRPRGWLNYPSFFFNFFLLFF